LRIGGGGATVLGSIEVVLMAVTRSVVVAPTFFPVVALFHLTMVVATVVVVVDARIWVEVSRFWGFDSSSSEDCWVFRKLAAPLPAVLRFGSFQFGLGFDGGVVGACYPLSRWFCFGRKLELWCGFVLILFVSSFGWVRFAADRGVG
jgi:hypothetical protein